MHAAPVGLIPVDCHATLCWLAGAQAQVTHNDAMAAASSAALAAAVAMLARMERGTLDTLDARIDFLVALASVIACMEAGTPYASRKDGLPGSFHARLETELPELLARGASVDAIQETFWSGAYVLESRPMAFACFLASPEDFETVVEEAACKSRDSDTVATMPGTLPAHTWAEEESPAAGLPT
jgi:ADP-ribosylglycohydrolase